MTIGITGTSPTGDSTGKKRAGVYARVSSKNSRDTSIEDQMRECAEAAEKNGWVILNEFCRFDKFRTGRTIAKRPGLQELVELAEQKPRPFDVLMFHSTSRAGRNLSDMLPLVDLLLFLGVELYFVDTGLSSTNPMFRDLFIMYARNDEHYSRAIGHNVKRGQRGRVLNGFVGCARTYGYKNRPIEDPVEIKAWGRAKVQAVDLEVNPEEKKVIERAFTMCAGGISALRIAKTFNREGIPAPLDGKKGKKRVWHVGTIIRMMTNTKYIGVHTYNMREQVRNPKTGTAFMKLRPESEWIVVPKPEWRIVSDELWHAAHAKLRHKKFNAQQRGGLNKSEASRRYIFSGIMYCRKCGGKINIVQATKSDPLYGCHRNRYNGTCDNELQVSQALLEDELLFALALNLESSEVRTVIVQQFQRQMQEAIHAYEARLRNQDAIDELKARHQALSDENSNLAKAVAKGADFEAISGLLAANSNELKIIKAKLEQPAAPPPKVASEEDLNEFLTRKLADIASVIKSNPERAKQEVQNRIEELWLEQVETDAGPAYKVTGDLSLFATPEDRMVDCFLKTLVHHSTSVPISVVVQAREKKLPGLTLKEAMRQVLLNQPGFTCTTRVLAAEIRDRRLYVRRDGEFADWKQINKEAVDCPRLFRLLGPGVVKLIDVGIPTATEPLSCSDAVATAA